MIFESQEKTIIKIKNAPVGQSAISIVITSAEGTVFNEDTLITQTICTCQVYEGVTKIEPNTYNWQIIENDNGDWRNIGTQKTVTIPIDKQILRKRIRCLVDIDR